MTGPASAPGINQNLYGGYFCKEELLLVARIVSFDTVGLRLLTFRMLDPYSSKDIALGLSHVISH